MLRSQILLRALGTEVVLCIGVLLLFVLAMEIVDNDRTQSVIRRLFPATMLVCCFLALVTLILLIWS